MPAHIRPAAKKRRRRSDCSTLGKAMRMARQPIIFMVSYPGGGVPRAKPTRAERAQAAARNPCHLKMLLCPGVRKAGDHKRDRRRKKTINPSSNRRFIAVPSGMAVSGKPRARPYRNRPYSGFIDKTANSSRIAIPISMVKMEEMYIYGFRVVLAWCAEKKASPPRVT